MAAAVLFLDTSQEYTFKAIYTAAVVAAVRIGVYVCACTYVCMPACLCVCECVYNTKSFRRKSNTLSSDAIKQ